MLFKIRGCEQNAKLRVAQVSPTQSTHRWRDLSLCRWVPIDGERSVWDRVNWISSVIGNTELVRSARPQTVHSLHFKHLMDFFSQLGTRAAAVT